MTTDDLISQAIHSINTNQPRMANLYMKNALEQTDKRRRELNPLAWQIRQLVRSLNGITASISGLFHLVEKAFGRVAEVEEVLKSDYALVGPSK